MKRIFCDRCHNELILADCRNFSLEISFGNTKRNIDLCPACGESLFMFLRTKPDEPDRLAFSLAVKNFQQGLPPDAPSWAEATSYSLSLISSLFQISKTTMRCMMNRANVRHRLDKVCDQHGIPCMMSIYELDNDAWKRLMVEIRKYRPKH